ncbi:MAG: hypothetical protein ACYCV7_01650 [Acidimicrobiales bacterium]
MGLADDLAKVISAAPGLTAYQLAEALGLPVGPGGVPAARAVELALY